MVCLTGLWARCSYGMVASRLCFYFKSTYRCFASSRCNNVLYIISVLSLFFRAHILTYSICTEKLLQNKNVFKSLQKVCPSQSMFQARGTLEIIMCVSIYCASPGFALGPWHVYLHPNVRVIVLPIAKSQYFLDR